MMQNRRSRTPLIVGFLCAGAALLGASFIATSVDTADPADLPAITIAAPQDGDSTGADVTITFRTDAPLALDPATGWTAGELHLHAMVDGVEIMPAAADIVPTDSLFAWRLPPLEPGSHDIHLTWAGRHHGNLPGATDTVTVHVGR